MAALVRDIQLDDSGNRVVANGGYLFASELQAVKQGIACRVRLFLGEYWLDESTGVDWLGRILVKNPIPIVVKAEIGRAIASTPDVLTVRNVAYSVSALRQGSVDYRVASTFGAVAASVAT